MAGSVHNSKCPSNLAYILVQVIISIEQLYSAFKSNDVFMHQCYLALSQTYNVALLLAPPVKLAAAPSAAQDEITCEDHDNDKNINKDSDEDARTNDNKIASASQGIHPQQGSGSSMDLFLSYFSSSSTLTIALSFFAPGMGTWVLYRTTEMGAYPQLSWFGVMKYSISSAFPVAIMCMVGTCYVTLIDYIIVYLHSFILY